MIFRSRQFPKVKQLQEISEVETKIPVDGLYSW